MESWSGKVAVVTGAGSGLGQAICLQLAKIGCHLALVDINQNGLEDTLQKLKPYEAQGDFSSHLCDVTKQEAMQKLVEAVISKHDRVNIIFNNAGIIIDKNFESQSIEEWELVVGINLWGVVYGCKFFLPYLKKEDCAHIVNTSSLAGFLGIPTQVSYSTTKAAVKALSEGLYAECKSEGVYVTSVHPGAIKTNLFETAISHSDDPDAAEKMFNLISKFSMAPDNAAAKIVKAARKRKQRVVVGIDAKLVEILKRLMPVLVHKVFALAFRWRFS